MRIGKRKLANHDTITIASKGICLRWRTARFVQDNNITQISVKTPKNRDEWKYITFDYIGKTHDWENNNTSAYYSMNCDFCIKGLEDVFGCIPAIIYFK